MKGLLGLGLACGVVLMSGTASAGCPNPCDMSVTEPVVEPPLRCGTIEVKAQDCKCAVWFSISNGCEENIDATGFSFDRCFPTVSESCSSIQPDDEGILESPLTKTGQRDFSFQVADAEGPHTITFSSNVTEFNDTSPLCSVATARGSAPAASGWPVGLLLLAAFARRFRGRVAE
jgi:hypothetical protein